MTNFCKHDLDNACSQCAGNVPEMGHSGQSPLMGACTTISKDRPIPPLTYSSGTNRSDALAQAKADYDSAVRAWHGQCDEVRHAYAKLCKLSDER